MDSIIEHFLVDIFKQKKSKEHLPALSMDTTKLFVPMFLVPRSKNPLTSEQKIFPFPNFHHFVALLLWSCFDTASMKTVADITAGNIKKINNTSRRTKLPEPNFWNNIVPVINLHLIIESCSKYFSKYLMLACTKTMTSWSYSITEQEKTFYNSIYNYVFAYQIFELIKSEGLNPPDPFIDIIERRWADDISKYGVLFTFFRKLPKYIKELFQVSNTNFGNITPATLQYMIEIRWYFTLPRVFGKKGFKPCKQDRNRRWPSDDDYNALKWDTSIQPIPTIRDFPLRPTVAQIYKAAINDKDADKLLVEAIKKIDNMIDLTEDDEEKEELISCQALLSRLEAAHPQEYEILENSNQNMGDETTTAFHLTTQDVLQNQKENSKRKASSTLNPTEAKKLKTSKNSDDSEI